MSAGVAEGAGLPEGIGGSGLGVVVNTVAAGLWTCGGPLDAAVTGALACTVVLEGFAVGELVILVFNAGFLAASVEFQDGMQAKLFGWGRGDWP